MGQIKNLLYWMAALDPALTWDQRLTRYVNESAVVGIVGTAIAAIVGYLLSYPWLWVIGLGIWVLLLSGLVTLGRWVPSATTPGTRPENIASQPVTTNPDPPQPDDELLRSTRKEVERLRADNAYFQAENEELKADKSALKKELEEARSSTSADPRYPNLIKELEQLREDNEGLKRNIHNSEIRNQFQITKAVRLCEDEKAALKKKVAHWENRVLLKQALVAAYKDGLFLRGSNPNMDQVSRWWSRTHQLIWAAFKGEKKADAFQKAEFSRLDSEGKVPDGVNATREQLMLDGSTDYLYTLIEQVDSLRPLRLESDFDGKEWVSEK